MAHTNVVSVADRDECGPAARIALPGSPFGIAWGLYYGLGLQGTPAFVPLARELGAGLTKLYVFWEQIQPDRGKFDWRVTDSYVEQLEAADEGLLSIFSSSSWATRRRARPGGQVGLNARFLPPSPALDQRDYYDFVRTTVERYRGRVRYWQNDAEPNSRLYWLGSREEFVDQLRTFYRAVKDADPDAQVIVGGYDGIFNPPGYGPALAGQQAGLAFFDHVLEHGGSFFDLFDLRLYLAPYTIPARVDYIRERMKAFGVDKPIVCTEYDGPLFFEAPDHRRHAPQVARLLNEAVEALIQGEGESAARRIAREVAALRENMATLPPHVQMFIPGAPEALDRRLRRLQACDLVIRNILALSAGVQKTIYWQLAFDPDDPTADAAGRDSIWSLIYGKIGLVELAEEKIAHRHPAADAFARMADALRGMERIARVPTGRSTSYVFKVTRQGRTPLFVLWERAELFDTESEPVVRVELRWDEPAARARDALGGEVAVRIAHGRLTLPVSSMPVFLEPLAGT